MRDSWDSKCLQERFQAFLLQMAAFFEKYPALHEEARALHHIADATRRPFSVAVFGRVKAGKSSLVNALIGKELAIMGSEEATATINRISHASREMNQYFTVHWKEAPAESFPLEKLHTDWTGKDDRVIDRVRRTSFLELFSDAEALKHTRIIDTPGTGSANDDHEKVAQNFLDAEKSSIAEGEKADALIYVFGYLGKEADEQSLQTFRKGCLPGSSPYNSVGVFHLWDNTYWDNGGDMNDIERKAEQLKNHMRDVVADIIPVSAPLALAAQLAPDGFFDRLQSVILSLSEEELLAALKRDTRWDREEEQASIRSMCPWLPWTSFRVLVRHMFRMGNSEAVRHRKALRELSGIDRLLSFLEEKFFRRGAIIKQRQSRAKARHMIEHAYWTLEGLQERLEQEQEHWGILATAIEEPSTKLWVYEKKAEGKQELAVLLQHWEEADRFRIIEEELLAELDRDMEILDSLDKSLAFLPPDARQYIRLLLEGSLDSSIRDGDVTDDFRKTYTLLCEAVTGAPDRETRTTAEHIRHRMESSQSPFNEKRS